MIQVLIVDDDPMVAELNRRYLEQIDGFQWAGSVSTLSAAQSQLHTPDCQIDLVLLDIYLHKENGLDLLPVIRQLKNTVDVIVISSASDMIAIKKALNYGVVDYLIKPFQFARFSEALTQYRDDMQFLSDKNAVNQRELDALIRRAPINAAPEKGRLPKGLTKQTLASIWEWIQSAALQSFSTEDLAAAVGVSRVSCRKYLMYLADLQVLKVDIYYGSVGRPVYLYKLDLAQTSRLDTILS